MNEGRLTWRPFVMPDRCEFGSSDHNSSVRERT